MISISNALRTNAPRRERKGVVTPAADGWLERAVREHPALFVTAHPERMVTTVYFDTADGRLAASNLIGAVERMKIRARWYGPLVGIVSSAALEFKKKVGEVGFKTTVPLEPFEVPATRDLTALARQVQGFEGYPAALVEFRELRPAVITSYRRQYFRSRDGRFRLTIDRDIQSYGLASPAMGSRLTPIRHPEIVVELKYDAALEDDADRVWAPLGLRVQRNSKYLNGIPGARDL